MTSVLPTIEPPLEVLRADLDRPWVRGIAVYANGDRVRFTYRHGSDEPVDIYKKARENARFSSDGYVVNPRPSAARVAAIRKVVEPLYLPAVEAAIAERRVEAAENERRDELRTALSHQTAAGPMLYEVLVEAIGDIIEPALAAKAARALAAAEGQTVEGEELPIWQYRAIGEQYWSVITLRAVDEAEARRLAVLELRNGRDKFHAHRSYLPEEVEARPAEF